METPGLGPAVRNEIRGDEDASRSGELCLGTSCVPGATPSALQAPGLPGPSTLP